MEDLLRETPGVASYREERQRVVFLEDQLTLCIRNAPKGRLKISVWGNGASLKAHLLQNVAIFLDLITLKVKACYR